MAAKTGVRTKHPEYQANYKRWRRCRDAMEGQDAIQAGRELYLPRLKEQKTDDYNAYLMRSVWYNASWRTTAGLVGMMFRKPATTDKIPSNVEEYLKNVNMKGTDFVTFTQNIATDVMEVGRIGLLVDHPLAPTNSDGSALTVAQAELLGMRPVINSYETECIINWKFRNIKNQTLLSLVVLTEETPIVDPDDEFCQKTETRYRVLDLDDTDQYRVRVYRINDSDEDEQVGPDILPLMNNARVPYIPFVIINPDGSDAKVEAPPLIDLVDMNISHYRTTADHEHGMHLSALPTFFVAGFNPSTDKNGAQEKIYLGSQSAIILPDPQAKAGFAEVMNGFQAHRTTLDAKKQEMATLGARMLADSSERQVETFGATAIKHNAENSILASIAIAISKGVTTALKWFCEWANSASDDLVFELNRDYMPVQMDASTLTAIMGAWQSGMLSEAEMFDLLKRGDVVEATKTLEKHQAEIDAAPPPAPPGNTQPGALGTPTHEEKLQQQAQENQVNGIVPAQK